MKIRTNIANNDNALSIVNGALAWVAKASLYNYREENEIWLIGAEALS